MEDLFMIDNKQKICSRMVSDFSLPVTVTMYDDLRSLTFQPPKAMLRC